MLQFVMWIGSPRDAGRPDAAKVRGDGAQGGRAHAAGDPQAEEKGRRPGGQHFQVSGKRLRA
jgi:hypothetical protein